MLSTVLKLLVVQVLIGMFAKLVHNIYRLWKIQIQQGKQLDISKALIIKAVKNKLITAIVSCIVLVTILSLLNYFINSSNSYLMLRYKYEEMQSGLNPNKTRFQVSDILCDDVLYKLADKLEMENVSDDNIDDMHSWFRVSYANDYQDVLDATSTPKIATEYVVRPTTELAIHGLESADVLDKLGEAYKEYFIQAYSDNTSLIDYSNIADELEDLDYLDIADYFEMYADRIDHYINKFRSENKQYESDNIQFVDIQNAVSNFKYTQVEKYRAYITTNGIQRDKLAYQKRLGYINKLKDVRMQKLNAKYAVRLNAIQMYDNNMAQVVLVPTRNLSGEFYMSRTKIGVDYLQDEASSTSGDAAQLKDEIDTNSMILRILENAQYNAEQIKKADDLKNQLIEQLQKLQKDTIKLVDSYIEYRLQSYIEYEVVVPQIAKLLNFKRNMLIAVVYIIVMMADAVALEAIEEKRNSVGMEVASRG